MIGTSGITGNRFVYQPPLGNAHNRSTRTRDVCFSNIWRKCLTDEAWYEFSDGTIYHYVAPAADEARTVANALIHGTQFDFYVRRDGFTGLGFDKVGSVPGDAELIYSNPPYDNSPVGACPTDYCALNYPSDPTTLAGANWVTIIPNPFNETFVSANAGDFTAAVVGPTWPSSLNWFGNTTNFCVSVATTITVSWTTSMTPFITPAVDGRIILDGTQIVSTLPTGDGYSGSKTVTLSQGQHALHFQLASPFYPAGFTWSLAVTFAIP